MISIINILLTILINIIINTNIIIAAAADIMHEQPPDTLERQFIKRVFW